MADSFLTLLLMHAYTLELDFRDSDSNNSVQPMQGTVDLAACIQEHTNRQRTTTTRAKRKRTHTVDCACCQEPVDNGREVETTTLTCGHRYHTPCLLRVLPCGNTTLCPMCRNPLQQEDLPSIIGHSVCPSYIKRVNQACAAIRVLRSGSPKTDAVFLRAMRHAMYTKPCFGLVHNICIYNIERAMQWRSVLASALSVRILGTMDTNTLLRVIGDARTAHLSTIASAMRSNEW